jgi:hypothetical protein
VRNRAALAFIALLIATASLHADVAIGAGFAILDTSVALGLAPAVFVIEAIIAYRIFRGAGVATPLMTAVIANLASSIVGFVVGEFAPVSISLRRNIDGAMLTMMALCIPFFFLSVVIEFAVARRMVPSSYAPRAWRWAIEANLVSYVLIELVLLLAFLTIRSPRLQELMFSVL